MVSAIGLAAAREARMRKGAKRILICGKRVNESELELVGLEVGLEGMTVMLLQVVTQWANMSFMYVFSLSVEAIKLRHPRIR
jgi:hypothetical protein